MSDDTEVSLEEKLRVWFSNLPGEQRSKIDFDYTDQFESGFFRGSPEEALEWLQENWETYYDSFISVDMEELQLIQKFRELAKDMQTEELQFDENAEVSLGSDAGAWVKGWVWVPIRWKANVEIYRTPGAKPPGGDGGWRFLAFSGTKELTDPATLNRDRIREQLRTGSAFKLGHSKDALGHDMVYLLGDGVAGEEVWTADRYFGLVVWTDTPAGDWPFSSVVEARASAREFVRCCSNWVNDQVFGYEVKAGPGVEGGTCAGFYTVEALARAIFDELSVETDIVVSCSEDPAIADRVTQEIEKCREDGE